MGEVGRPPGPKSGGTMGEVGRYPNACPLGAR
jgi:hypothetical protein